MKTIACSGRKILIYVFHSAPSSPIQTFTGIGTETPITRLWNYRALWRERRIKVFDGERVRSIDARAAAVGRGPEGDALHARALGGFRCEGLTERFAHAVIEEVIRLGGAVRFGSAERGQSSVGSSRARVRMSGIGPAAGSR